MVMSVLPPSVSVAENKEDLICILASRCIKETDTLTAATALVV